MFQFIRNFVYKQKFNTKARDAFTNFYKFARESESFKNYCKHNHGIDCFMQNNVSKLQFKAITKNFEEGMDIIDIGCGTGDLTKYIAKKYKLNVNGVDLVSSEFKQGNFEITSLGENRYDLAISFDGFYMLNDIKETLNKILKSLKPKGKFILTYTTKSEFKKTKLAKALKDKKFELQEFTKDDFEFNKNAQKYLESIEQDFIKEGNSSLYRTKYNEIKNNVLAHKDSKMRRYIVTISK